MRNTQKKIDKQYSCQYKLRLPIKLGSPGMVWTMDAIFTVKKWKQCQFDVLPSRRELNTLMVWWCKKNLIVKWVSSPPASASICCWAEAQPAACLSQHVLKLAGEEVLSCANYILIIGNVLANQALIAISESASSSRVKRLSELAKTCWAFSFHRR